MLIGQSWYHYYRSRYRFGLDWDRAGSRATDLILFSVEPAADGTVAELGRLTTSALNAAREARDKHGTRLHVCVGGAGRSANFGTVAKSPELRKKFGMALLALAQVEKLDGLDFDWEAQIGNEKNFAKLIRGIKKASRKRLPELTVSVAGTPPLLPATIPSYPHHESEQRTRASTFLTLASSAVRLPVHPGQIWLQTFKEADFIHLMSYDSCPGAPCRHATLESAKEHVGAMLKAGVPAPKLLLGIPAYAREMNHPQEVKTYEEIHRLGAAAATLTEDADELAIEGGGEWWFNGTRTQLIDAGP